MKKKAVVFFALLALSALFAGTGLFAQDKRPRNLADSKIQKDTFYDYAHCTITGYSGPKDNPAANGPVFEDSNNSATKGKRFPLFIMLPDKFESEPIGGTVKTIQTGPGQTVEITVSTDNIVFGPSSRPRLLVIQPNSKVEFNLKGKVSLLAPSTAVTVVTGAIGFGGIGSNILVRQDIDVTGKKGFVIREGSIKEDKDFKIARDADTLMEFYSSAADSWMGKATINNIDKYIKSPGDTKEQLANKTIAAFQTQNAAFSVLSSLAPIWMMPASVAVDMTKNMMKASLAYGLWYCYTGKTLTGDELKSDLYILLDNNDVESTLKTILEKSGEALDKTANTIEVAQKIGKFLSGTNRGAAAFANLAKANGKIAAKITAQASKAADAVPVASTVLGLANDVSDMQIFANQVKYYYGLMSSPTIVFDPNGGSAPRPASKTVNINDFYGELPVVSRDGYRFDGWYTAVTGGTKIMDVSKVTVTGGQTLYARWIGRSVTVDFNSNGGSAPSPSYRNVTVGSAYGALPTVTRAGYSFSGWHTQASGGTNTLVGISTIVAATGDHKLYARWSVETGSVTTISFEPNGGTAPSSLSKQLSPGSAYGDLPTVSRGGYKFDGWYTAATGGNKIESTSRFDGSVKKLYAHWINPNDITVTFNSNGGGAPNPASKTVTVYFDYGTLPAVTRDGYKFEGWYTAASGGTKVEGTTKVTNKSAHSLYARWTANTPAPKSDPTPAPATPDTVTITFNSNGGSAPNPATRQVTIGSPIGTLPTVTRSGYTFDGWFNALTGGGKLGPTDKITGNYTTFYARWTANTPAPKSDPTPAPTTPDTVTITFNSNGGSAPNPATRQIAIGSTYGTLPTVTRSGYTFDGWYTAATGGTKVEGTTKVTNKNNAQLYARWTASTITITFNSNGGSAPNPATKQMDIGSTYGTLPTVTRSGYKFDGWFNAVSGGGKLSSTDKVTGNNTTFYAHWTADAPPPPETITITFNSNGGSAPNPATRQIAIGSTYGTLPTVTRSGYKFDGWFNALTGGGKLSSTDKVTGNHTTFYAHWTADAPPPPETITITFNSNGGSAPNPATRQIAIGSTYGTLPTVTRSGYKFDGWYNDTTGWGKISPTDKVTGNYTTFYARWIADAPPPPSTITVTFDGQGGTPGSTTKQLTIDSPIGPLPTVTRSGYKFDGWYNAEGGKLKADGSDKFTGRFTTFYARWTR